MKKLYRMILVALCAIMGLSVVGCSNDPGTPKETATPEVTAEPTPEPTPVIEYTWKDLEAESTEIAVAKLKPTIIGRVITSATSYTFNYSSGGVEFGFTGTSLSVDFNKCGAWVAVYVDDMEEIVINATEKGLVQVVGGLSADQIHCVRIQKRSESNAGQMIIKTVKIDDGAKFYVKEYKSQRKRIEVLGDSIACGYGNIYGLITKTTDSYLEEEDGTQTFATMLADYYQADLCVCCISGIGVGNSKNSPWPILPSYKMDGNKKHDFTKDIPDLLIIELGQNDFACGNTGDEFIEYAHQLVDFIRGNYPDVPIIWYYGIMGEALFDQIDTVVKSYNDAGDKNIYFLKTHMDENEPQGGAGHPSVTTMRRMTNELVEFISKTLSW